jgi:GNAT superfamily N-acetyltransferase
MSETGTNPLYSINIRRAFPADAGEIIAGIRQICREGGAFITDDYVPTPDWETALYRPESDANRLYLAVVEVDGKFAGAGRLFAGGAHTRFQHVADLGLFLLAPYRRAGLGRRLVEHLLDWARGRGVRKITLVVLATNTPARGFFRQFGFKEEGVLKEQIQTDEGYVDLIQMALFLE